MLKGLELERDLARKKAILLKTIAELKPGERIYQAFAKVPRERFLKREYWRLAYADRAIDVAEGASISQPTIICQTLMAADISGDMSVCEVGTGTGYQTALIRELTTGQIHSSEINPILRRTARTILSTLGYRGIVVHWRDGLAGDIKSHGPFDRIIVSAGLSGLPEKLLEQLTDDGILIAPIGGHREPCYLYVVRRGQLGGWSKFPIAEVRFHRAISSHPGGF